MERIHEIEAETYEATRAWVVEGKATPLAERATLNAELAALRLRRLRLDYTVKDEVEAQVAKERAERNKALLRHLMDVLTERGEILAIKEALQRTVADASREATA
jgi:hypothetical protein